MLKREPARTASRRFVRNYILRDFESLGDDGDLQGKDNKSALKEVDAQMRENIGYFPQYWGDQPGTSAPYAGAIIVFLFVFSLFIIEGRLKWALLIITILSILALQNKVQYHQGL